MTYPLASNTSQSSLIRSSKNLKNLVQLIHIVASLEQGLSSKHLSENASDRPHVNYKQQ